MRKNCPAILKKTKKRQVLKVGRMSGLFRRARKGEEGRGRAGRKSGKKEREEKKRQVFKNRSEICTYVISKIDTRDVPISKDNEGEEEELKVEHGEVTNGDECEETGVSIEEADEEVEPLPVDDDAHHFVEQERL